MYFPFFRGKQFELITLRETADLLSSGNFVPIIEPVKESLSGLKKTLDVLCKKDTKSVVIVNPQYGDHSENATEIERLVREDYMERDQVSAGMLLRHNSRAEDVIRSIDTYGDKRITFIHAGFPDAKILTESVGRGLSEIRQVFIDNYCSKPYRNKFLESPRILVRDGFERMRNADYQSMQFFSDLHLTYKEEGMDGFGDFLVVGDDYFETGGPAYAVVIHITFIDKEYDNEMRIYHFKSETQDTPADPAGKFLEALEKLIVTLDSPATKGKIFESGAIKEFRQLYDRKHYPGLGYIKKLSMKHHIETIATYLRNQG